MLPCCAIGAFFILQVAALCRWFKRVVLRKEPEEDENEYWQPAKVKLKDRIKSFLSDPRKKRRLMGVFVFEAILVLFVWLVGGFEVIQRSIETIAANPDASIKYIWECCFGK